VLEDSSQDDTDLEKCLGEVRRLCEAGRISSLNIDPARLRALQRPQSSVTVLVVGGFDGAFHHDLGNVHALHRHAHLFGRLLLLGRSCVAELLLGPEQLLAQERYHQQRWQRALAWRTDAEVASEPEAVTGAVGTGCSSSEIDACSPPTTAAAGDVARHELSLYRGVEGPTCGLYPLQGRCERVRSEGLRWNLEGVSLEFGHFISTSNRIMSYGDGGMGSGRVVVEVSHTLLWTHEYTLSHHPQPVQRNATAIIT
jgi:thiamine pyrophosphokinase